MTVYDFVKGIFSDDKKVFKLTNSKKLIKDGEGKLSANLEKLNKDVYETQQFTQLYLVKKNQQKTILDFIKFLSASILVDELYSLKKLEIVYTKRRI